MAEKVAGLFSHLFVYDIYVPWTEILEVMAVIL